MAVVSTMTKRQLSTFHLVPERVKKRTTNKLLAEAETSNAAAAQTGVKSLMSLMPLI